MRERRSSSVICTRSSTGPPCRSAAGAPIAFWGRQRSWMGSARPRSASTTWVPKDWSPSRCQRRPAPPRSRRALRPSGHDRVLRRLKRCPTPRPDTAGDTGRESDEAGSCTRIVSGSESSRTVVEPLRPASRPARFGTVDLAISRDGPKGSDLGKAGSVRPAQAQCSSGGLGGAPGGAPCRQRSNRPMRCRASPASRSCSRRPRSRWGCSLWPAVV